MTWNDQQWLEMFQMMREMFYHIVSMLGPHIVRQDTDMRWAIPPDKRVAMVIMKLSSPSSLRYITNQFGIAACTIGLATREMPRANAEDSGEEGCLILDAGGEDVSGGTEPLLDEASLMTPER
ncbi:hypothetical protein Y1Q_0002165 [Alligator mississippiensis]|uniref:Uncharacterized protein n=1 Tax=Alligator mississippiensis TaxID=8496 RepID=A0A151MQ42_ALLMI|nr:hypothetical protein Y1Q_0002165 [Alligator mississippiensis]